MQDQVEALAARGLGDRVALVNAQQDGATNAGGAGARRGGRAAPALRGAGALRRAGLPRAHAGGERGPVRGRRGALRLAVGPRLPARLLPPRRRRAHARRAGRWSPPRPRPRRAWRVDVERSGSACATRCAWPPGFDRPNIAFAVARPGRAREAGAGRRGAARAGRPAGDRVRRHARGLGGAGRRAERRARRGGGGLPRRPRPRAARDGAAPLPRGRRAGDLCHQRVRDGRGQGERAHRGARERARRRSRPTTRRPAAPGATAQPARALLLAENRDKALHVHFIKREQIDEELPGWLADRHHRRRPTATGATCSTPTSWRAACGGDGDRLRALLGHLTRAGVIAPSPSAPDRVAGRVLGPLRPPRRGALPLLARGGRRRRAGASTARSGPTSSRTAAGATAILRHFGDRSPPARRPGALLRRCDPGLVPAPPPPDPVAIENLDDAIISVAQTGAAGGGADHLRGDPARRAQQEAAAQLVRRPARLRHARRACGGPTSSRAWTS